MANKPSIPKGTRDFSPDDMIRRNFIFDTIRSVFKKYGYQNIETPAMENTQTLLGKYGEEGDKLIFRILNSGDYFKELRENAFLESGRRLLWKEDLKDVTNYISEKALRYDLTVPFARYVVQHQNEITFPFKRYQIQPVWRADRPQKGRYREFYQCDADVIGSNSLINEVELVQMIDEAFTAFNVPVTIKINNRKILAAIPVAIGEKYGIEALLVAIDKLDKIGIDGVNAELREKKFNEEAIQNLQPLISFNGTFEEKIAMLEKVIGNSEEGRKGIDEIKYVFNAIDKGGLHTANCELDISLARGLNYYTGAIFEVKANKGTLTSSICGGGRYDDLTGIFGLPNVSGVGISFGIDRIFDVLNEVGYPTDLASKEGTRLMFFNDGGEKEKASLQMLKQIRAKGIASEIYPDSNAKWEKQAKYVDAKNIPFTARVNDDGTITLKFKSEGKWKQEILALTELINKIS